MAWLPKKIVLSGLFAGLTPEGSLNGVPGYLGSNFSYTDMYAWGGGGHREDIWTHEGYQAWSGAYGSNAWSMLQYAQQHGPTTDLLLAEMDVMSPNEHTWYRQSIAFYGTMNQIHEQTETHEADWIQVSISKVCRLVYADPQSPPYISHTWQMLSANNPTAWILISGDPTTFDNWVYDSLTCGFGLLEYDDKTYFGAFLYAKVSTDGYGAEHSIGTDGVLFAINCDDLSDAFEIIFTPDAIPGKDDPNEEEPPEDGPGKGGSGGGEGDHVLPDEPVLVPPLPILGSSSVSWLTTYMMTLEDINEFGEELVQPNPMQMLKQYFVDPLDAVVNITLCPAIPTGPRYQKTPIIHASPTDYEWSRSFTACGQYGTVNCGFIDIPPYWDSAFDFDPFTQIHIFLPFIGYRALNADEVMGAKIGVIYHVDVVTGDCTAFVTKNAPSESIYGPMPEQVIGQYNGNCGVSVPIGRVSHDAFVGSMMNLMTVGASVAIGGVVGGEMAAGNVGEAQLASQLTSSGMNACSGSKSKIERSGALGGNCGYMGVRKPYIIRNIARQDLPDNYKDLNGYPCNKGGTLGQYSGTGLAVVESIQLNNIPAMEEERKEILEWLKGGVLI